MHGARTRQRQLYTPEIPNRPRNTKTKPFAAIDCEMGSNKFIQKCDSRNRSINSWSINIEFMSPARSNAAKTGGITSPEFHVTTARSLLRATPFQLEQEEMVNKL